MLDKLYRDWTSREYSRDKLAISFAALLDMDEHTETEWYSSVINDNLSRVELEEIIEQYYDFDIVMIEDTPVPQLKRKIKIGQEQQRLPSAMRPSDKDSDVVQITKTTRRLVNKDVTSGGEYKTREKKGNWEKTFSDQQERQRRFKSVKAKELSQKAARKRTAQAKGGTGKFVAKGTGAFISKLS